MAKYKAKPNLHTMRFHITGLPKSARSKWADLRAGNDVSLSEKEADIINNLVEEVRGRTDGDQ